MCKSIILRSFIEWAIIDKFQKQALVSLKRESGLAAVIYKVGVQYKWKTQVVIQWQMSNSIADRIQNITIGYVK